MLEEYVKENINHHLKCVRRGTLIASFKVAGFGVKCPVLSGFQFHHFIVEMFLKAGLGQ